MSEQLDNWERQTLEKVALAAITEQRRARKWSIFFKLAGLLYLFLVLFLAMGLLDHGELPTAKAHTALVNLEGVIAPGSEASAERIIEGLQSAFKSKHVQGVILRINSPGGSPVQSGQINDEIKRLKAQNPRFPCMSWWMTFAPRAVITSRSRRTKSMSTKPRWSAPSAC